MIEVQDVETGVCWWIHMGGKRIGYMHIWGDPADQQMAYWIDPEYRGRGCMKQALNHVLRTYDKPFKLVIHKTNHASIRVACSCGFLPVVDRGRSVEYRRV